MPTLNDNPNVHYVKFIRGSIQAWERLLQTPANINDDTLYFIYASAENTKEGKLYLGQKLISGVGGGSSTINIDDIGDIYIDGTALQDKQILVFNETSGQWENTSLSTIINTAVGIMTGATENTSGTAGLVPVPTAGQQNRFLRGDGTWTKINLPTFNSDVFTLNNEEVNLNGFGLAAVGSVPIKTSNGLEWTSVPTGQLNRKITTLEKLQAQIAGTDSEPIDANAIYMVNNGNDPSTGNIYDEYMIINNRLERLGTFGQVNLENYVQVPTFNTAIGSINDILQDTIDSNSGETIPGLVSRVSYLENNFVKQSDVGDLSQLLLSPGNTTLVEEVNTLNERLKWQELETE